MKVTTKKPLKISKLCESINGELLSGKGDYEITSVALPEEADDKSVVFLWKEKYGEFIKQKTPGCIVTSFPSHKKINARNIILHPDPRKAFSIFLKIFTSSRDLLPSMPEKSDFFVGENTEISPEAIVFPNVFTGDNCFIGEGTIVYPFCYIGNNTRIGKDCVLFPGVVIYGNTEIGDRVRIHSSSVIGSDGFGYVFDEGKWLKIEHRGGVIIEDDVEIGAGVCIDRGTLGYTLIGEGAKIDNLVQIAHNVKIGKNTVIASQTGVSGSTVIGNNCIIGGQAGFTDGLRIGNNVSIGPKSGVHKNIKDGEVYTGYPAIPHREWLRVMGSLRNLPDLRKKIQEQEK